MNVKNKNKAEVVIGLSAVIVSIKNNNPKVFIVRGAEHALSAGIAVPLNEEGYALPFGPFEPEHHETLEKGLNDWVETQTPITTKYVEQLYTFSSKDKYFSNQENAEQLRKVLSIGYLALTSEDYIDSSENIFFDDWYNYFPWEDWREGKPEELDSLIIPYLLEWVNSADRKKESQERKQRVNICFGLGEHEWDEERVHDRYEILYETNLIYEATRDSKLDMDCKLKSGHSLLYDHRRILATAISRLRGKLKYRPVVFDLMSEEFTLLELQKTVEAIRGQTLHKQNFRRYVENSGMVEQVLNKKSQASGGRPAALFRFKRGAVTGY